LFGTNVSGKEGVIRIEEIGATIGVFSGWRLDREMKGEEKYANTFRFNGTLKYINPSLFDDEDYAPVVLITTGRDRRAKKLNQYRLELGEGSTKTLNGRSLLMTGVTLCPLVD